MKTFFGITGFEIRYQLRNPVFWVAIAIFFLLGFGVTASENVRIGTPGAVHENAPFAIAVLTVAATLFYLFVITAFVANAIVRDESSGFAPIVRATPVSRAQIVLPDGFEYEVANIGSASSRTSGGPMDIDIQSKYAQFANLHLSTHGVVRTV